VRLALQLNPIVDAAYALTAPGETDIVLAGASVAQSSREYWEVRLIPSNCNAEIQDGVAQNGACLGLYSDANTAVLQCLGLREPKAIIPTGFQQPGASRRSSTWLRVRPAGTRRRSAIRTSLAPSQEPSRGSGPLGPPQSPRPRSLEAAQCPLPKSHGRSPRPSTAMSRQAVGNRLGLNQPEPRARRSRE
jgi:hypothetical protein